MLKRFLVCRRTGFYLRVLCEGEVGAGDKIVPVHRDENRVPISDALRVHLETPDSGELRKRALRVKFLSSAWREELRQQP